MHTSLCVAKLIVPILLFIQDNANELQATANATFDSSLGAPSCLTTSSSCDTGTLVDGRGRTGLNGKERNGSNSLDQCKDGRRGVYHKHGSIDRILVKTMDGDSFKEGSQIWIEATVYAKRKHEYKADFYYTNDAASPNWIYIGEKSASSKSGLKVLTMAHTLFLPGTMQAVRVNLRQGERNDEVSCSTGSKDDVDDVAFAVI